MLSGTLSVWSRRPVERRTSSSRQAAPVWPTAWSCYLAGASGLLNLRLRAGACPRCSKSSLPTWPR